MIHQIRSSEAKAWESLDELMHSHEKHGNLYVVAGQKYSGGRDHYVVDEAELMQGHTVCVRKETKKKEGQV